jgi:membrane-bound lytic murein transglycosylase D
MIVKSYIKILSFAVLLFSSAPLSAQTILDDPEEEEEEEVDSLFVPIEDEISVRDMQGNEELIEFPEAMTFNLDSLLELYMTKTYLSKGDCEMKDENPTYTPEEYIERLRRMPTVMEMAYNDIVQRFIDRYMGRLRHSVSLMLGAANFYIPIFEEALEAYQVPL